jgi:predicted TIM-barrel fold metal-dependent hydrolase
MLVNCHAHLFTAYSVTTATTVRIAARRAGAKGGPLIERAVESLLNGLVKKPELLSERDLLRALVRGLVEQQEFKDWLNGLGANLPVDLRGLLTATLPLGEQQLQRALTFITHELDKRGGRAGSVSDVIETIRLALKPNSTEIARVLLEQVPPDAAIVGLMMDISGGVDGAGDARKFKRQIKELESATLAFPGRIFPFIAVNTNRKDHLARLSDCVLKRGFVGVKLYPSLGYSVESDAMRTVLAFCAEHDVPVTMHCSSGGFYRAAADIDFCNPSHWTKLLGDFPTVRVCFAHCGGGSLFCEPMKPDGWDSLIVGLMEQHENAYADLSYHADQMRDDAKREVWLGRVRAMLDNAYYGTRILFGTDSWLVRAQATEEAYWDWFREALGDAHWRQVAEEAPRRFLGLPDGAGQGCGRSIQRHLDWLVAKKSQLRSAPLPWVVRAGGPGAKGGAAVDPQWDIENRAHWATWAYFHEHEMNSAQKKKRDFPHAATLSLGECHYYTKGFEPDDLFREKCLGVARRLIGQCKQLKAAYEGDWTDDTLVPYLADLLAEGDRTLGDLGAEVDEIFAFKEEE